MIFRFLSRKHSIYKYQLANEICENFHFVVAIGSDGKLEIY